MKNKTLNSFQQIPATPFLCCIQENENLFVLFGFKKIKVKQLEANKQEKQIQSFCVFKILRTKKTKT
jgi:hypothetical protein